MTAAGRTSALLRSPAAPLIAAALLLLGDYLLASSGRPVPCLFRHLTGIPCPTCGATRAGMRLLHLDLLGALRQNPLVTCAYLALPLLAIARVSRAPGPRLGGRLLVPALLTALAANWAYVLHCAPR